MSNKQQNPKVSARPPEKKESFFDTPNDLATAFIKQGSINPVQPSNKPINAYPWENAREDVYKTFNLRLPEEYAAKLDYVAMKMKSSKHSICMEVVKKEVDRLVEELVKGVDS